MIASAMDNAYAAGSFASLEADLPVLLRAWIAAAMAADMGPSDQSVAGDPVSAQDWSDIRSSLDGDGDAFDRLVRRYQQAIGDYMWRFTRDRGQWEELVHDAFVEAYLSLSSFQGRAPILHWLKRIATRTGYRFWRSRKCRQQQQSLTPEVIEQAVDRQDSLAAQQAAELVHCLLGQLGARDRLVLTLTYLEACSVEETAELTGWTQSMVKVQAHRARKRLRRICEEKGIEL